jgi:hypothetical protein
MGVTMQDHKSEKNKAEQQKPESTPKSKFNEQEYQRWSETLRSKNGSKSK